MATTSKPRRVQLRRTKGWTMPANTVKVARPTKWGNPFVIGGANSLSALYAWRKWLDGAKRVCVPTRAVAVAAYRDYLRWQIHTGALNISELRGRNLACFCKPGEPCHADVLLEIANQ